MARWAWVVVVFLAGCSGGDEQVCTPLFRYDRRCDSTQFGLLRCNRAGTGFECETSRECSDAVPCSILPICVQYADPSTESGSRSSCAIACTSSADCAGSATRTCCAPSSGGGSGCVVPNPLAGCLR